MLGLAAQLAAGRKLGPYDFQSGPAAFKRLRKLGAVLVRKWNATVTGSRQGRALHLVQGGIRNGDQRWLERTGSRNARARAPWVVPKSSAVGDEVTVYVAGHGLFATARTATSPVPHASRKRRYGAFISSVRLIAPPISLNLLQEALPSSPGRNILAASRRHYPIWLSSYVASFELAERFEEPRSTNAP